MSDKGSRWDPDADEIKDARPYDYESAKRAIARGSRDQSQAADWTAEAARDFAQAEKEYREALAIEMVNLHDRQGVAWSACPDLARGDGKVAELRRKRDVAEGVKEAAEQRAWQASANRRSLEQLVNWSMKVAPLGDSSDLQFSGSRG